MNTGYLLLAVMVAGYVISGQPARADDGERASEALTACSSYCAEGDIYCPPNPLMECYFYCTKTCVVCDGETTCYDNPPPG